MNFPQVGDIPDSLAHLYRQLPRPIQPDVNRPKLSDHGIGVHQSLRGYVLVIPTTFIPPARDG
jgi:hypothetical protein